MSLNHLQIIVLLFILGEICLIGAVSDSNAVFRSKRQTYIYDQFLKQYARPHPKTKIVAAMAGRYAPNEWPDWYTRTLLRWSGEFRFKTHRPNNVDFRKNQHAKL